MQQMRDMVKAEALDDATLVVTFAESARATCRCIVAALPIFSQSLLRDAAVRRDRRSISRSASGPYKVGKFEVNRYIEFERVKDWWGADLPVNRGSYNFDIVRYEFYRDRDVAFEGFTGKNYLFREEFTSRIWATRYDFPGDQGRPRQARDLARRDAVRRAGLVHQHPPRQVQGPARARSARSMRSISNGPTRPSCTAPMRAPIRRSRIRT